MCFDSNIAFCISVGCNAETQFEKAVFERYNITPYTFDPTLRQVDIDKLKSFHYMKFYEIGVTGAKDLEEELAVLKKSFRVSSNAKMMTIQGIMESLNHSYVDVLKMDCEGCEESFVQTLPLFMTREKPLFGQFLVEFHR